MSGQAIETARFCNSCRDMPSTHVEIHQTLSNDSLKLLSE